MGKNSNFSKKIRLDREILDWAAETKRLGWDRHERNPDDYADAFYADQMKNYDVRRAMETFNLAKSDEAFKDSLGSKKLSKFIDSYETSEKAKGKEKDGQIIGLSNANELGTIRKFQELYHKKVRNKAGKYDDQNDYGGGTAHMMDAMRNYRGGLTNQIDTAPEPEPEPAPVTTAQDYTLGRTLQTAMDFEKDYEAGLASGALNPFRDRSRDSASGNDSAEDAASSFLSDYTNELLDLSKRNMTA